jgi:hypothetical protein
LVQVIDIGQAHASDPQPRRVALHTEPSLLTDSGISTVGTDDQPALNEGFSTAIVDPN